MIQIAESSSIPAAIPAAAIDQALRKSELNYRRLFEMAQDGILILDALTGRVNDVNPSLTELLGFTHGEMVGKTVGELSPFKDIVSNQAMLELLQKDRYVRYHDLPLETKAGHKVDVEFVCNVYPVGEENVIQCSIREITDRKLAEEALRASHQMIGEIINALPARVFWKDKNLVYLGCNTTFARDAGFADPKDIIGKNDSQMVWRKQAEAYRRDDRQVIESGRPKLLIEESQTTPAGKTITLLSSKLPLRDGKGEIIGVLGTYLDITARKEAQAALHESERFNHATLDALGAHVAVLDGKGNILATNQAWREFALANANDWKAVCEGANYLTVCDEAAKGDPFASQAAKGIREVMANETKTWFHEYPCHSPTAERWFSCRVTRFSGDGPVRVVVAHQDITARKRGEEALRLFRELIDHSSDGVEVVDPETGRLLDVNETTCQRLGYTREELLSMRVADLGNVAVDFSNWGKHVEEIRHAGFINLEGQQKRKDGSTFPIEASIRYVKLERDYLLASVRDITERKRVEASLARLAMAVEQAAESVVITDTEGTILYANPAFEKTSGYTRAEALGQNPRVLKSGKHDAEFYARMWETLRCGATWSGHLINRRKDGKHYEEEANISPLVNAAGTIINYVAVKRDVTHEVQLQEQFRQAQKMEAIGQLAGGVAHDFNNILSTFQMQADLLKYEGGLSTCQLESVSDIVASVQRGVALTRQLLLFSRREVFQPADLDLNETVATTAKMLKRMLGETIEMQLKLAAQPLFLLADAGMLDQVLMNLCVNARDAMPGGGRLAIETSGVELDELAVAQTIQARAGSFVCLSVSDNGSGIAPEILPQIFEPFFTTKPVGKGTGLGLATVFGIVQQHQGWINVYSEIGQGTTFRIYLPRLAANVLLKSAPPALADLRGGHETILLAEDDPALRVAVRKALSQLGYRILEAPTGVKALEVWQQSRDEISLLLTDLVMPDGMSGTALAQRLLQENPKLKVIYMSGYSAEVVGKNFPLAEDVSFLTKPFPAQKLAQTIRDRLDARP